MKGDWYLWKIIKNGGIVLYTGWGTTAQAEYWLRYYRNVAGWTSARLVKVR